MCQRDRPNEAFSGRNHGRHLCRDCGRLPKAERQRQERLSTLWNMLHRQSNISRLNVDLALEWATDGDEEVTRLAALVAAIGKLHPGKRKRLPFIRKNHPSLWQAMVAAQIVEEWPESDEAFNDLRGSETPHAFEAASMPEVPEGEDEDIRSNRSLTLRCSRPRAVRWLGGLRRLVQRKRHGDNPVAGRSLRAYRQSRQPGCRSAARK